MILPDTRDGSVYASLDHGHFGTKVHRSSDEGETWEEIACPEYPEPPEGSEPEIDAMGREIPWKLVRVWSLEAGSSAQPGRLWCGTIPRGLLVSNDRGDSWECNSSHLPPVHCVRFVK